MLGGAASLLYACHSPVGGRVCSPIVGVKNPRSGFKLHCEVGRSGVLLLGKKPLCIPPQGLSTGDMQFCDAAHHPVCVPTKSAAAGPTLDSPLLREH